MSFKRPRIQLMFTLSFGIIAALTSHTLVGGSTGVLKYSLKKKVRQQYAGEMAAWKKLSDAKKGPKPIMRRDVHQKANACVTARFNVKLAENIPTEIATKLQSGIFAKPASFSAIIRYSNGQNAVDNIPDARGMAIKVAGITESKFGPKVLRTHRGSETQDFVLMTGRTFFLDSSFHYLWFGTSQSNFFNFHPARYRQHFKEIMAWGSQMENPLSTEYQSVTPYRLGKKEVVKYAVKPCNGVVKADASNENQSENYLTEAMATTLDPQSNTELGDRCYRFMVQFKPSTASQGSSTTEWPENQYPFYEVAKIEIPLQAFNQANRKKVCEDLAFTPWHTVAEHRPLGAVNRARRSVYQAISTMRRLKNLGEIPSEPTQAFIDSL